MKQLQRLVRVVGESVIKRTIPDPLGKIVLWLAQPFLLHSRSGLSHFIAVNDIYSVIYNNFPVHITGTRAEISMLLKQGKKCNQNRRKLYYVNSFPVMTAGISL